MARIQYIPNRVIDTNGIADGASIYVYESGGTTPVSLFSDSGLTTPISNPVVVAAGAQVTAIYTSHTGALRVRVVDSGGTTQQDDDPFFIAASATELSATTSGNGASKVGFYAGTAPFAYTTVQTALTGLLSKGTIHASALGLVSSAVADQFDELSDAVTYCSTNRLKLDITGLEIRVDTQANQSATYKYLGDGDVGVYAIHETAWLAIVGKGTIGNLNENSDQTIFFCENCEYVEIGDGVTLDGYNTDGGYSNAIQCYGCEWVHIGEAKFYRNSIVRIGASSTGMTDLCTFTKPRFVDCYGTHCIGGKPGGCREWRGDTIYISNSCGGINFEAQDENGFNASEANWSSKIIANVNAVVAEGINGLKERGDGTLSNTQGYAVAVADTRGAIVNIGSITVIGGVGSAGAGGAITIGAGQDNLPPDTVHIGHIHAIGAQQIVNYVPSTTAGETIVVDKVTGTYIANLLRATDDEASPESAKAVSFGEVDVGIIASEFIVYRDLSGDFTVGETVTGDVTTHTATVVAQVAFTATSGILVITGASGSFNGDATITGGTSTETATQTFRPLSTGYGFYVNNTNATTAALIDRLSVGLLRAATSEQAIGSIESVTDVSVQVDIAAVTEGLAGSSYVFDCTCTNFDSTRFNFGTTTFRGIRITQSGRARLARVAGSNNTNIALNLAGAGTAEIRDTDLSAISATQALSLTSTTRCYNVRIGSKTIASGTVAYAEGGDMLINLTVSALTSRAAPATTDVGTRAIVTDANATTFASTVAGSGSNIVPVVNNGTNWIIG